MLILQRREGEKILIGEDIEISVVSVEGNRVRLAISAPREVSILRGELREAEIANQESVAEQAAPVELLELLGSQGVLDISGKERTALKEQAGQEQSDL